MPSAGTILSSPATVICSSPSSMPVGAMPSEPFATAIRLPCCRRDLLDLDAAVRRLDLAEALRPRLRPKILQPAQAHLRGHVDGLTQRRVDRIGACLREVPEHLDHRVGRSRTLGNAAMQFRPFRARQRRTNRADAPFQCRRIDHQRHALRRNRQAEDAGLRGAPVDDQRLLFALFRHRERPGEFRDQLPRVVDLCDGENLRQFALAELAGSPSARSDRRSHSGSGPRNGTDSRRRSSLPQS